MLDPGVRHPYAGQCQFLKVAERGEFLEPLVADIFRSDGECSERAERAELLQERIRYLGFLAEGHLGYGVAIELPVTKDYPFFGPQGVDRGIFGTPRGGLARGGGWFTGRGQAQYQQYSGTRKPPGR